MSTHEFVHINDIESAINHWRERSPSPDGVSLTPQLQDLAAVYALMCWNKQLQVPRQALSDQAAQAWLAWYDTTPDTPCIAICSTAQGDKVCKGCGRTFEEVKHWSEYSPLQKRAVWQRITQDGSAWRFNKYAERAGQIAQDPAQKAHSSLPFVHP